MKKTTVVIGIPAFNEQSNIGHLIQVLLKQRQKSFVFQKIIISSDGSTDATNKIVKNIKDSRIRLISNSDRLGVATRQNQIMNHSNSDILVLLNADISVKDKHFIEKLIRPLLRGNVALSSSAIKELPPKSFVEKTIACSMSLKNDVYEVYKGGLNLYTCHGPARAFSKKLYKKLRFNSSIGEDAYSYLYCVKNNFRYQYVAHAKVFYQLPRSIFDHQKQSVRFFHSKRLLSKEFGEKFVNENYKLPFSLILTALLKSVIKHPILTTVYILIVTSMFISSYFSKAKTNLWDISVSSKLLNLTK